MLTIIKIDTWIDFEKIIRDRLIFEVENPVNSGSKIYRGHPDANWELQTTLERKIGVNLWAKRYYKIITENKEKIETYTNQKWKLPSYEDFLRNLKKRPSIMHTVDNEVYNYLTYLRHFGFPSHY